MLQAWRDPRDVVHRAVQALVEGQIVAFPTETVYGIAASARNEAAVERLLEAKKRPKNQPLTLAIKSADEAYDYVPGISSLGKHRQSKDLTFLHRSCTPTFFFETPKNNLRSKTKSEKIF